MTKRDYILILMASTLMALAILIAGAMIANSQEAEVITTTTTEDSAVCSPDEGWYSSPEC